MPDYEIRYFHADGSLALIHVSFQETETDAHREARNKQADYHRYEIRGGERTLSSQRR